MTPELKAAIGELGAAFEEFKAANDLRLKELEARGAEDPLTTEKLARIDTALNVLETVKAEVDDMGKCLARRSVLPGGGSSVEAEHVRAFGAWFRHGDNGCPEAELRGHEAKYKAQAGMQTQSDPDGGFLVPEEMAKTIRELSTQQSAMRGIASVFTTSTGTYKELLDLNGTECGWVGETEQRKDTDGPKLASQEWEAMELYAKPKATQTLLDDAMFDIGAWLGQKVAKAFGQQEGDKFIHGTGVKQPKGLAMTGFVKDSDWAWGKYGFIASGSASGINTDALIDMQTALAPEYASGATWLMNRKTQGYIRKLKDNDDNYLWRPGLGEGVPSSLLGVGIKIDDFVDSMAANKYPVYYGDFKEGYLILDRFGIRVLRDPYSNKPWVEFYTTKRVGGGPRNYEAIKALKIAA